MLLRSNHRVVDSEKDTQFTDAWIVLAILLTLAGLALDNAFLTVAALAIVAVIAVAWGWAALSLVGVHYTRSFSETRAFQGETVHLTLEAANPKWLPVTWLNINDHFPPGLPVAEHRLVVNPPSNLADFNTYWMLAPFQRTRRRFDIRCTERGFHSYGPAALRSGDPFGFFTRSAASAGRQVLIVYPRIYPAETLGLPSKNPFGEHPARGLFEDPLRTVGIRSWQAGDTLRRVHWKASARKQELLSRAYEPSEEVQVQLFLNVATLERHWHGYLPELQERTISVAGSLAALAAGEKLPVGLAVNGALPGGDQAIRLAPSRHPGQLTRILEMLAAVTPFAVQPIELMLPQVAPRLPWGATLVVVTAIAHEPLLAALLDLAHAGRRVVLFTLAEKPPARLLERLTVYHLPHLVEGVVAPRRLQTGQRRGS